MRQYFTLLISWLYNPLAIEVYSLGFVLDNLGPQVSQPVGSLFLNGWACLLGPAGPPIVSRSASEQLAARQASAATGLSKPRYGRKTIPLFALRGSPAPPGPVLLGDRGRSQSFAASRLSFSDPLRGRGRSSRYAIL